VGPYQIANVAKARLYCLSTSWVLSYRDHIPHTKVEDTGHTSENNGVGSMHASFWVVFANTKNCETGQASPTLHVSLIG